MPSSLSHSFGSEVRITGIINLKGRRNVHVTMVIAVLRDEKVLETSSHSEKYVNEGVYKPQDNYYLVMKTRFRFTYPLLRTTFSRIMSHILIVK